MNYDLIVSGAERPLKNLAAGVRYVRDGMITLSDLLGRRGYDICGVSEVLKRVFEDALGVTTVCGALTDSEDRLASHLMDRHRSQGLGLPDG